MITVINQTSGEKLTNVPASAVNKHLVNRLLPGQKSVNVGNATFVRIRNESFDDPALPPDLNRLAVSRRKMLMDIIKEPFAWPGGYAKVLVLADGAILCHRCCRDEGSRIMSDIRDGYDTGWMPAAISIEAVAAGEGEDAENQCGHCNRPIGELGS